MSDHAHVEPPLPSDQDVATRWFAVGITGIVGFISIVFIFIL